MPAVSLAASRSEDPWGLGSTVTVTDSLAGLPVPLAARVYVVVSVGEAEREPLVGGATGLPLMVVDVASVVDQVSTTDSPKPDAGRAERERRD